VHVDQHRADEPDDGGWIGEDPDYAGAALDLLMWNGLVKREVGQGRAARRSFPSPLLPVLGGAPGSTWSARSAARTYDVDAGVPPWILVGEGRSVGGLGAGVREVDRAREDGVDRRTAKLMFAGRDRMSAMRR
jgi:hypothetical protein